MRNETELEAGVMDQVTSRIESVTVFRDGAVVTRVAELIPVDGLYPQEIRLSGLPLSLEDDSLRARVVASDAGSPPVASDLRMELLPFDRESPPPASTASENPGPTDRPDPLRQLIAQKDVLQSSFHRLAALEPRPRLAEAGKPPREEPLDSRRQLVSFRQSRLAAMQARLRELEAHIERLRSELLAPSLSAPEMALHKAVIVRLRPPSKGCPEASPGGGVEAPSAQARLYLSYRVPGARWAPAYAFRFDRDLTMAEVLMRASVYQYTGEDWEGVQLLVSTSDPTAWKELPDLPSWRIGRRQASPIRTGWRPPPAGADLLYEDYDRNRHTAVDQEQSGKPPFADLTTVPLDSSVCLMIPEHLAQRYRVLPLAVRGNRLTLAMADPNNAIAIDDIRLITGFDIDPVQADEDAVVAAIHSQFGVLDLANVQESVKELAVQDFGAATPVVRPSPAPMARPRRSTPSDGHLIKVDLLPTERRGFNLSLGGMVGAALGAASEMVGGVFGSGEEAMPGKQMAISAEGERGSRLSGAEVSGQPGKEHLRYGALRMPGPAETTRGRLQPLDPVRAALHGRFLDEAAEQRLRRALQQAHARASKRVGVPSGHHYPESLAGFDYLYPGDSRVHVPSDGQFHSLPLLVRSLPARPLYVLVPRESPDVFRVAEVDSLPDLALPAGPADIYIGGDFLLATELESVGPGGTVPVGLGVEQSLKVARNTRYKESTTGMMGGTQQLRHEVDIEVSNRLEREVRLQVWERLPAAEREDVKISVDQVEPPWERCAPPDQPWAKDCSYRWSLSLGPRAKTTLKLSYIIEIPSKMEISGGNRREPG